MNNLVIKKDVYEEEDYDDYDQEEYSFGACSEQLLDSWT